MTVKMAVIEQIYRTRGNLKQGGKSVQEGPLEEGACIVPASWQGVPPLFSCTPYATISKKEVGDTHALLRRLPHWRLIRPWLLDCDTGRDYFFRSTLRLTVFPHRPRTRQALDIW